MSRPPRRLTHQDVAPLPVDRANAAANRTHRRPYRLPGIAAPVDSSSASSSSYVPSVRILRSSTRNTVGCSLVHPPQVDVPGPSSIPTNAPPVTTTLPFSKEYVDSLKASYPQRLYYGAPSDECPKCAAVFWTEERIVGTASSSLRRPVYTLCCRQGRVYVPPHRPFPPPLNAVMTFDPLNPVPGFMQSNRQYNSLLQFTSVGVNVDRSINIGSAPCVFRINGVVHHVIGSLLPPPNERPQFAQLYIYDTANEISNRLAILHEDATRSPQLDPQMVGQLIAMLDTYNPIVKKFRLARDRLLSENAPEVGIRLIGPSKEGRRNYSLPTVPELAPLIVGEMNPHNAQFDIIVQSHDGTFQHANPTHPTLMALQYPLLFPHSDVGFHLGMELMNVDGQRSRKRQNMSMLEYYRYEAHYRRGQPNQATCCGRLSEQFIVDAYSCIEASRLSYFYFNQPRLRTETYQGIFDAVSRGDMNGRDVGIKVILPASFTGGKRYMTQNCQDSLAICREYGCPQLFITFTCNPRWPEIKDAIAYERGQRPNDRPDIITRVFHMKQKEFLNDVKSGAVFGQLRIVIDSIEFQKRGLPHSHNIMWLVMERELTPEIINSFISAEIPDPVMDPLGYSLVEEFMVHGPCGHLNLSSPCMIKGTCSKRYPKKFYNETTFDSLGYPIYRRRCDGRFVQRGNIKLDNRWIVPYNPSLLKKFQAHINVEWCVGSYLIKYLFKYVTKGPDCASVSMHVVPQQHSPATRFHCESLAAQASRSLAAFNPNYNVQVPVTAISVNQPTVGPSISVTSTNSTAPSRPVDDVTQCVDEIADYINARYLSACEACWRIWEYEIHQRHPSVERLIVHLPGMNNVTYYENRRLSNILEDPVALRTMLTEWFTVNQHHPPARNLTYCQFPSKWTWYNDRKEWCPRKQGTKIGRLRHVHPSAGELFYLRMLLMVVKGATCYVDVRTYNGMVYDTFREACKARGLISDDGEWTIVFDEAVTWASSGQIRGLLLAILLHCAVADALTLYNKYWKYMVDDIAYEIRKSYHIGNCVIPDFILQEKLLQRLHKLFSSNGLSLTSYGLPAPAQTSHQNQLSRLLLQETAYDRQQLLHEASTMCAMLNSEQCLIYNTVLSKIHCQQQCLYFVSGHGGTGKTFLWKSIIVKLRSDGHIVLAVASSGVAALLLPGGRTAHSRFAIPITIDATASCSIGRGTPLGELIKRTTLILWDEAPMTHRHCIEALDRALRDLLSSDDSSIAQRPFGGKSILFGGDFRQILPVVEGGTPADIINASLIKSPLWRSIEVMRLTVNMRLSNPSLSASQKIEMSTFAQWILDVGEGHHILNRPSSSADDTYI